MAAIDNVELIIKQVYCVQMTKHEAGDTDEIYFAVTSGGTMIREQEFDIRTGQVIDRNRLLWSCPIGDGSDLIFTLHLRETDSIFVHVHTPESTQNLGDAKIYVRKNGDDVTAWLAKQETFCVGCNAPNYLQFIGAESEYRVRIELWITSGADKRLIYIKEQR